MVCSMGKYKVLSTKKLLSSLIEQAKQNDIDIIEQEFISFQPIITKEKAKEVLDLIGARKEYVVFTSANAVAPFKYYFHLGYTANWKVFCLSGKTKEAIENSGFLGEIVNTAENASGLAQKIVEQGIKEIIFFCGNKRRDELPDVLRSYHINVHEVVVYETIETPSIATDDLQGLMFFSPSAVTSFFSVNQINKQTVCFAIGKTTANTITGYTDNKIIISEYPSQEMMLATVNLYFQNINCYE
jgi:uroporphyrinogen-III synthase